MSRMEDPMDYAIRPTATEVYDDKEGKYDGKAKNYFAWNKSVRQKVRKEGQGDLLMSTYYEMEKPEHEIKLVALADKYGYGATLRKSKIVITQDNVKSARETIKSWAENAEKVKSAGLIVLGIIEGTMTEEAWYKTNGIQEDETISERGRVIKILNFYEEKNNKFCAQSVEEIQNHVRETGSCVTRKDVETMITQIETAQIALKKIPASVIMRSTGIKEEQTHNMTDRHMNEHMLKRLPQKPMWEQLKAEVVERESDTTRGAFTTEELTGRMERLIATYTIGGEEERKENKWNEEGEKDPQRKRRITEQNKERTEKETKTTSNNNVNSTKMQPKDARNATQKVAEICYHYQNKNCKYGENCQFSHIQNREENNKQKTKTNKKETKSGGKSNMANTVTIKEEQKQKKRKKDEDRKEKRRKIQKLEERLKQLKENKTEASDSDSEEQENNSDEDEYMTDSSSPEE